MRDKFVLTVAQVVDGSVPRMHAFPAIVPADTTNALALVLNCVDERSFSRCQLYGHGKR